MMKQLLSTLGVAIIGASSGSLLINSIETSHDNQTFAQEWYWNPAQRDEIRQAKSQGRGLGTQDPNITRALYTFNLGTDPKFSHFEFLDPTEAYVTWGNSRMGTWNLTNFDFKFDEEHHYRLRSINDDHFFSYLKYPLFDETYRAVFASLIVRLYFGYTWYIANNQHFFQFLVFEYINVRDDSSSALNEINLGKQVNFS